MKRCLSCGERFNIVQGEALDNLDTGRMFFIWVVIIGLLQMTVLRDVNLLLLLAVFSGLRKGALAGLLIGAAIGVFVEILSSLPFGFNLMLYSIVGLLAGIVKAHIYYKENIFMEVVFSFCGLMFFYIVYFILIRKIQASIFPTVLFSALFSPFVFRIIER